MSIATLYNISTSLRPGPKLTVRADQEGVWTASLTFTCQKFQLYNNLSLLEKGTPLPTLYPDAGDYGFLFLLDWDSDDQPGGITEVTVNFRGVNYDGDSESSFDQETNVTYTRTNATKEESIFKHPKFLDEVSPESRAAIKALYDKTAYRKGDSFVVLSVVDQKTIGVLSESEIEWHEKIIVQGFDTWLKPTSEWTKSATARGTIPAGIMSKMGKIDTPPGNPKAPPGDTWIMSGSTESIPVIGDGVNNYSITWTSGIYPEKIFE